MKDPVRQYLTQIARYPLLKTHEEEVALSTTYRNYQALYDLAPESTQALLTAEEKRLFKSERMTYGYWKKVAPLPYEHEEMSIIFEGIKAKYYLYCANLRLVVSIAKRYSRSGLPLLDAVQYGNIGLLKAIERFDPSMGFKLSTYAYWWIRQQITRAIGDTSREIRLPIHIYDKLNKIKTAYKILGTKYNKQPSVKEVAKHMRITEARLRELLMFFVAPMPLDYKPDTGNGEDKSVIDIFDYPSDESEKAETKFLQQDLVPYLQDLSPRELEIIVQRFGLNGDTPKSLNQICLSDGIRSRERIRQIEAKALNKLKIRASHLQDYLE